jgi:hypothetical protein
MSIDVMSNGAGTCHVDLTFGSGTTSSVDVNFMARRRALGDDPHGCGQEFVAVCDAGSPGDGCPFSVLGQMCDAGL